MDSDSSPDPQGAGLTYTERSADDPTMVLYRLVCQMADCNADVPYPAALLESAITAPRDPEGARGGFAVSEGSAFRRVAGRRGRPPGRRMARAEVVRRYEYALHAMYRREARRLEALGAPWPPPDAEREGIYAASEPRAVDK